MSTLMTAPGATAATEPRPQADPDPNPSMNDGGPLLPATERSASSADGRALDRPASLRSAGLREALSPEDEFSYAPVPILVPVAIGISFLSLLGLIWDVLVIVPLTSGCLAWRAARAIRNSEGTLSGLVAARITAVASVALAATIVGYHAYSFATEIPEGYRRVSFTREISEKGFVTTDGVVGLHPDVAALEGQELFLKGYMYPTKQVYDIKGFVLCKDKGECCFGGQPSQTDMVYVEMQDGLTVDHKEGVLVAVAGKFVTRPTVDETGLNPVYKLEAKHFSTAKTAY